MLLPDIDDTIVAVSSGWEPTPVGILRVSGPESFSLLEAIGVTRPGAQHGRRAYCTDARVCLHSHWDLPASVFWFAGPRSYTGQDVVEVHTVGNLAILRALCDRLVEAGARRAQPGEFTARAFILGKLDARQVEGVLMLLRSAQEAAVREGARLARGRPLERVAAAIEQITDLLALVEAGIDFVEEEDIRFVSTPEAIRRLDAAMADLRAAEATRAPGTRVSRPHVAFAGLPNAGKSTLFNCLLGYERALVSPIQGTTRDVLSAELVLDGRSVVLQDCAGFGAATVDVEHATRAASERATQQADIVIWVHAHDSPWRAQETEACQRIPDARRILVWSKADLRGGSSAVRTDELPVPFSHLVAVSALTGSGLGGLRTSLAVSLDRLAEDAAGLAEEPGTAVALAALARARVLVAGGESGIAAPELVALELRQAHEALSDRDRASVDEEVLGRIFSRFCVGK